MKKNLGRTLLGLLVLALGVAAPPPVSASGSPEAGGGTAQTGPAEQGEAIVPTLATNVLEYRLVDPNGRRLGTLTDLIIDVTAGYALFAVFDLEAATGAAGRRVPIPIDYIVLQTDKRSYRIELTDMSILRAAPTLRDLQLSPEKPYAGPSANLFVFWPNTGIVQAQVMQEKQRQTGRPYFAPFIGYSKATGMRMLPGALWSLSQLLETPVVGRDLGALGRIQDLAFGASNGKVVSALFGRGGGGNQPARVYPMPLSAFTFDSVDGLLIATASAGSFAAAPSTGVRGLPSLVKRNGWQDRFHAYWVDRYPEVAFRSGIRVIEGALARASEAVGADVVSWRQQDVGTITDLVVEKGGSVPYALVELRNLWGGGGRWYPVPLQALTLDRFYRTVLIGLGPQELQKLPSIPAGQLPDTCDPEWDAQIRAAWQEVLSAEPVVGETRGGAVQAAPGTAEQAKRPQAVLSGAILGSGVRDPAGATLGELADLVLDLTEGRVAYAAVSFGGVLGLAEKLTLVPFDRFDLVVPFHGLVLNASGQTIRGAPSFRETDWPSLAEPSWYRDVRNYWQVK